MAVPNSEYLLNFKRASWAVLVTIFFTQSFGCSRKHETDNSEDSNPTAEPTPTPSAPTLAPDAPMDEETKTWWIQKANNALRLTQPISDVSRIEDLLDLTPNDITDKLIADIGYYDMMTDFTTYWLGFKASKIWYSNAILKKPRPVYLSLLEKSEY